MKRFVSVLLSVLLVASLFCAMPASAEEASTTERVYNYNTSVDCTPDIWLCQFDESDQCIGNAYVVFNAAAPFTGAYLPFICAGTSANQNDADLRFELFEYDTDDETTMAGTPVFKDEQHFDGDVHNFELSFGQTFPAGQYLFKLTEFGDRGPSESGIYIVLPRSSSWLYSESVIGVGNRGQFGFAIDFVKTEGVTSYFKTLQNSEYELEPLQTISEYIGGAATSINSVGELVIVTPEVPAERVLYNFTLTLCPTWGNTDGNSDAYYEVYKWKGDYVSSVDSGIILEGEILDHKDNSDLTLVFGTTCRYGNRYMIIITAPEGALGYYLGSDSVPEGWLFFEGENEASMTPACKANYAIVGDLGPEATEVPEEVPTEVPATEAPEDDEEEDVVVTLPPAENEETESSSALPAIIGICAGVLVIAAIVVIVIKKRK